MPTGLSTSQPAGNLVLNVKDWSDPKQLSKAGGSAATNLLASGSRLSGKGEEALGPVLQRLMKLLSGDEGAVSQAIAPQARGVIAQYDTARRAAEEFSPKGSSTASAMVEGRNKEAGDLGALRFGSIQEAQQSISQIASMLLQAGTSQQEAGQQGLNDLLKSAIAEKAANRSFWKDIGLGVGKLALGLGLGIATGGTSYIADAVGSVASQSLGND